jgi:hypothetical protein
MHQDETRVTRARRDADRVGTALTAVLSFLGELNEKTILTRPLLARSEQLERDVRAARAETSLNQQVLWNEIKSGREVELEKRLAKFERIAAELRALNEGDGGANEDDHSDALVRELLELAPPRQDGAHAAVAS